MCIRDRVSTQPQAGFSGIAAAHPQAGSAAAAQPQVVSVTTAAHPQTVSGTAFAHPQAGSAAGTAHPHPQALLTGAQERGWAQGWQGWQGCACWAQPQAGAATASGVQGGEKSFWGGLHFLSKLGLNA